MAIRWPVGLFALLLWLVVPACQRAPYRYQPLPAAAPATNGATVGPQLLFMSFNMSTGPDGTHRLEQMLVQTVAGQVNPAVEEDVRDASYLLVTQLGADNRPCAPARRVAHPLVQDVEAPGPNGALQRRLVPVPQAEFFIRLARVPQARAVRLQEVGPAAPQPISVTFPLPN